MGVGGEGRAYRAYWTTPLVPSSLGRRTSLRGLARLDPAPWGVRELASRRWVMGRTAAARKGMSAVVGLTVFSGSVSFLVFVYMGVRVVY